MSALDDELPVFDTDEDAPRLRLDLAGYEGPLDLMLDLARREKIDLAAISMLALAEQYLVFIAKARALKLEVAADYLVMAAWLAWLKSRLLLPAPPEDAAPPAEELAEALAVRLERLAAFRKLGAMLGARHADAGQSHPRGGQETLLAPRGPGWTVSLPALLSAYGRLRLAPLHERYEIAARRTLSIPQARALLEQMVGQAARWCPLTLLLEMLTPEVQSGPRSALASGLVAALELAREGRIELRQEAAFAPLMLRVGTGGEGGS